MRRPIEIGGDNRFVTAAVSADGTRMLVAPKKGPARIQDVMAPRTTVALGRGGSKITSAAFSPDSRFLLTNGADGMARVWTASGEQVGAVRDPFGRAAAVTSTGELALTTHDDATARLLRVKDGKQIAAIKLDFVAIAYGDGTTRLWDGMTGRLHSVLPAHGTSFDTMAFNPDGTRLATAARNTVRIWNVHSGTQVSVLRANVRGVVITSFSPDGRFILTAGFLGTTTVWDAESGEPLANFRGGTDPQPPGK